MLAALSASSGLPEPESFGHAVCFCWCFAGHGTVHRRNCWQLLDSCPSQRTQWNKRCFLLNHFPSSKRLVLNFSPLPSSSLGCCPFSLFLPSLHRRTVAISTLAKMTLPDQPLTSLDQQHHGSLDSNAPTTVATVESKRGSQDAPQNEKQQIAQADPNAPTGLKFALILVALYAAVFLVALVSIFKLVCQMHTTRFQIAHIIQCLTPFFFNRTELSWRPQFPKLRVISTHWEIFPGMPVSISSRVARRSPSGDESTPSTLPSLCSLSRS